MGVVEKGVGMVGEGVSVVRERCGCGGRHGCGRRRV